MWSDGYIGLPFSPDGRTKTGLDCWGLVQLVYREQLGIELPSYSGVYTMTTKEKLREVAQIMDTESRKWAKVDKPQDFDVVRLRTNARLAYHVGIVIRRDFLHITNEIQSTREPLNGLLWKDKIQGFYRHEALCKQ